MGFVVNPRSGQDIRRLVARASVFPNTEKAMMLQRVLTALGAVGVDRVVAVMDKGGVAGSLAVAVEAHDARRDGHWPAVEFLELPLTGGAEDSVVASLGARRVGRSAAGGARRRRHQSGRGVGVR